MTTIADFKIDGLWQKSQPGNHTVKTHAYQTFSNMVTRTQAGGKYQARQPSYIGCQNGFESFQAFTDWAIQQVGYAVPGFELDKDLLVPGNKVYSPETCCFLPAQINLALHRDQLGKKSDYPVGICTYNKNGLKARISIDGKLISLAYTTTDTPENRAFLSNLYERAKQTYLHQLAERFKDQIDPRAYQALLAL